jgi:hypothetical protein
VLGLNAVIVAVTDEVPRILTVRRGQRSGAAPADRRAADPDPPALPFGPLDPVGDRTLELGLRRWVDEQTGLSLGYVEQLYTFGDRDREPGAGEGGRRVLSVAYLALVREETAQTIPGAAWTDAYRFLPWEDWREGRPAVLAKAIEPRLERWVQAAPNPAARRHRAERVDIAFGLGGAPWDGYRVLERYELLYEAGLLPEAVRDRRLRGQAEAGGGTALGEAPTPVLAGETMAYDHRRILATALGRLRGKIRYRPVVFELLPSTFTLLQLQRVVEALAGVRLHKQNFRRLVDRGGLVEGTGQVDPQTGGRPAELFAFRRDVLRERPTPGVGLPAQPL